MIAIVLGAAAVGSMLAALLGAGLVPLWAVALVAGVLALATRLPRILAVALGIAGFPALELLLLLVTPLIGVGMTVPHVIVFGALSALSAVALRRATPASVVGTRDDRMLTLATLGGSG